MNEKEFVAAVKQAVADQTNAGLDLTDGVHITPDDVFIVWMCKTLQNSKALASTTVPNGAYFEITYNGDKHEMYVDEYRKWKNTCVKAEE